MIRAAFIGINRYADPQIRDLGGAVRDATALWALLSDSIAGLSATLLTNENANLANVSNALEATLGAASEIDVVFLSFAGHGTPDHRLVVADSSADDLVDTTIAMSDLAGRFRTTRARAVILLLDCCFSGGAPARVLDIGLVTRGIGMPLREIAGNGRVLLAACAEDESALEDPVSQHGLFTKAVIARLLEAVAPVNVMSLVEHVVQAVRADAGRWGYAQTPVMFGHVEGELQLPAGHRGDNFKRAFPEQFLIKTSGAFDDFRGQGLPDEILDAWRTKYPGGMNSLQVTAVNEHGIANGNSALVVAPTSAGKTFVGELAAVKAITEGRKAVFLLPYKALVNEKYEDFAELYGQTLGIRVARASGDWQDQVSEILRGKYDIAFFTYEKFLGLALASPRVLHQVGLVVLDEAQFITDPHRGIVVELLLTRLATLRQRGVGPQVIALSAVIGDTNGLEKWLDCSLLRTTKRPVPLQEGVVDRSGVYQFVTPDGSEKVDQMLDRFSVKQRGKNPSSQDLLVPLVRKLVRNGETVLIFRNQRGRTSGCAEYLARELDLPPAAAVLASLPEGDLSATSVRLRNALNGGVAFHHSDLNREERAAVEKGFRAVDGGIRVLVATSTVAAGINTPASTVVIVETEFPGGDKPTPYTVAQYRNMAGRAGRLGFETEGKAILLADTTFERGALFRRYVRGNSESIRSCFDPNDPGTWVVRLLAQVKSVPRESVVDLLANTFGGYLATLRSPLWRQDMSELLERLLDRMLADCLIDEANGGLTLSMLGRACGESPLSLNSSMRLIETLRGIAPEDASLEVLLVLAEALPERDLDYTPQLKNGEAKWTREAENRFGYDVSNRMRSRADSDKQYYARCKRALIVNDWINGVAVGEIETRYSVNATFFPIRHGDIRGFVDGTRFIFESIIRIATILMEKDWQDDEISILLMRLEIGIPEDLVSLTTVPLPLTRGELLELSRSGLTTYEDVRKASLALLEQLIGIRGKRLHALLQREEAGLT